jgi:hypothetical protein
MPSVLSPHLNQAPQARPHYGLFIPQGDVN